MDAEQGAAGGPILEGGTRSADPTLRQVLVADGEQNVDAEDIAGRGATDEELPVDELGEPLLEDAEPLPESVAPLLKQPGFLAGSAKKSCNFDDSDPEVDEDLKDAIEGSFRLKRLLSREDIPGVAKRRRVEVQHKTPAENAKIAQLLSRWGLTGDDLTRHVLENLTMQELSQLAQSGYSPDVNSQWKGPSELLHNHVNQVREQQFPGGGGPLDLVSCFRHRWKLDISSERLLRSLGHKDLRYVLTNFDGKKSMEEMVEEAAQAEPEDGLAIGAAPDAPGPQALGRFSRLELISPVADCAIFGDANLTFALGLARQRRALGHVGRNIATTFENLETLQERYKEIDQTIEKLEALHAEVYHAVDCTRLAIDERFTPLAGALGVVYYNFPHAGAVASFFDGHPVVNWRHENLMRLFFRALCFFMKPGGIVRVSSNSGAVGVRFSYIIGSAVENEFQHTETMPFLQWALHRYGRSYGDRRDTYKRPGEGAQYDSQRADSDMVYCFVYKPSGNPLPKQRLRLPPTYRTLLNCVDGALGERQGEAKKKYAADLFKRFMLECTGTHVG